MKDKTLSIIIPYYTETKETLFGALSGISGQAGVDFEKIECILVNDGNKNVMRDSFLSLFKPLSVRCVYLEQNGGPGVARQAGIDAAAGEYVMFCDADDSLYSFLVLKYFIDTIMKDRPDILYSPFFMERYDPNTGAYSYQTFDAARHLMHGKAYKKLYLKENGIRFHEALRIYEDTYFNALAFARTENIGYLKEPSYIRKYRGDSLTRGDDPDYFFETLPEYIACIGRLCDALVTGKPELLQSYVVKFTVYFYFTLQRRHLKEPSKRALLEKSERMFFEAMIPHIGHFETAPADLIDSVYGEYRPDYFTGETETETIREWVGRIKSMIE